MRVSIKNQIDSKIVIKELYIKHGFTIKEKGEFLLISFKNSDKIDIITKYVDSVIPLTFNEVKTQYEEFYKLGNKVKCYQYRLICIKGFESECEFFNDVNLALSGKEYIDSLYNVNHIELYSHNDIAYRKLEESLKYSNKSCVIQPTGTGKSLILSNFINQNQSNRFILLSPNNFIISEVKKHLLDKRNLKSFTYSKLIRLTADEIYNLNPDYIIVDEFHRCGADEWGAGVNLLIETFPKAKLIGTTATHIRYLDEKRNMADELFENNIARHLTLSKALSLKILPIPKYISALYKFDEEYIRVKKIINDSLSEEKKRLLERLNKIKLEFENTSSIPNILKEHLNKDIDKIIVFCKDIRHLKKHKNMVLNWFNTIGYGNIKQYEVHSDNLYQNKVVFKAFEESKSNGLDIMFSVNMLNEGIHVKGANCIIMLRDTESPIIYYQQLGRCLTVSADKPIIFDFVNNFANIRHRDFVNEINEEAKYNELLYKSKGIPYEEIEFEIIDKVRDIKSLCEKIEETADSWNVFIEKLTNYKNEHGDCNVSKNYENAWLGNKVSWARYLYKINSLKETRIKELENLGFNWVVLDVEENWNDFFQQLEKYKRVYGNCNVPRNYYDVKFYNKVSTTRVKFKKGNLNEDIINKLENIGFVFDKNKKSLNEYLTKLDKFKKEHGHCNVPYGYIDKKLYLKTVYYRREKKNNRLDKKNIEELNKLGFMWETEDATFSVFYSELKCYKKEHGHCNVSQRYKNKKLANKVVNYRRSYKKGILNKLHIEKLNKIGFIWDIPDYENKEFVKKLKKFKKEFGHCNVSQSYKEDKHFVSKANVIRLAYKENRLDEDIYNVLNKLGFIFEPRKQNWIEFIDQIKEFKKEHGHCNIPYNKKYKNLNLKVRDIRRKKKKNTIKIELIKKLNELGFSWNPYEDSMNLFYKRLENFKKEHGHCKVTRKNDDKWLLNKCVGLRKKYRDGKLEKNVIDKLIKIGFKLE
jgi:superfamily II DNA or RNA helicase